MADAKFPQSTVPLIADPITKKYSKEIVAWAVAILTSAWTQWVFTSKSNKDSSYQTDSEFSENPERIASRINIEIALPYIPNSILDALEIASEIGLSRRTEYRPRPTMNPMNMILRKD